MRKIKVTIIISLAVAAIFIAAYYIGHYVNEKKVLEKAIKNLEADTRIAEVLVTKVDFDEVAKKLYTTVKFLEYDTKNKPLTPKYFTFCGNIIQFQSLVIRFDDIRIRRAEALKGKSVYLFWKVFMLDGSNTREYEITKVDEIPQGYKIGGASSSFEEKLWAKFWEYALNPKKRKMIEIKNAQIEAPGTMFIPGIIYTIKIEHDGGIRIDSAPISEILKGEYIPKP